MLIGRVRILVASALTRYGADILEVIFDNCIQNRDLLLILLKNNLLYRVMTLINEYIVCAHNETDPSVNPIWMGWSLIIP